MKRIAFLGRGGHTLPTYRALLNRVAEHYEVFVYSEVPLEQSWLQLDHRYTLRGTRTKIWPRRIRELIFLFTLIKDHLKNPFHIVHAHSTYPTGFAAVVMQKIFRVPALVSLHAAEGSALPDIGFGDLLTPNRTKINGWVIRRARVVTALSNFQRNEVRQNLGIQREILVIPRGVDLRTFYFERKDDIASPVLFLSVGYLNPIKDPETLLRAFSMIRKQQDSRLMIVGKDYSNGSVQRLAKELGIAGDIEFEGFLDHDAVARRYRQADVLLHTSRYESQGMVVAEAMAAGVLVCGTRVGLLSDLSGKCCVTVPPHDPEALARAVLALLGNKEEARALRERAYAWSRNNNVDTTCEKVMALYSSISAER